MSIVKAITDVFTEIGDWIVSAMQSMLAIFWTPAAEGTGGSLTILGVLAICGLAISIIMLVIGMVSRFLKFRG